MKQLPQKGKTNQIETRPAYIKDWLDALPYIDFEKTGRLLEAALQATNETELKPATRLALIKLYDRPYQNYLAARLRGQAQSASALQERADLLKRIALNLSDACDIVVKARLAQKTLWLRSRSPIDPMLMLMNYLSRMVE